LDFDGRGVALHGVKKPSNTDGHTVPLLADV
jgi:hypothetical protein